MTVSGKVSRSHAGQGTVDQGSCLEIHPYHKYHTDTKNFSLSHEDAQDKDD